MTASSSPDSVDLLSEGQRRALISLLADEDPVVHELVRSRLLAFGPVAGEWLRPHTLAGDPLIRRRAQEIVHALARQSADDRFLRFCQGTGPDLDLEEGVWLLAQTRYPECNLEAYQALVDSYAAELQRRTDPASRAEANLLAINQHLYQRLRYHGNEEDYYDPDNSYLNRVVDQRTGNPISLCILYMMVARRVQVLVSGIGLPGHFMCRYQSSQCEIYIDCFNQGRFLTRADCIRYLAQSRCSLNLDHLAPMSNRRILLRLCANLHQAALRDDQASEIDRFHRYLAALGQ
jgi:regulator of sirC expression with transglutaminase-like and TPR domain